RVGETARRTCHLREVVQRERQSVAVSHLPRNYETYREQRSRHWIIALPPREAAKSAQRCRTHRCRCLRYRACVRQGQQLGQSLASFRKMAVHIPEAPERSTQSQADLRIAMFDQPPKRRPQVVVLTFQPGEPLRLPSTTQLRFGCFGQSQKVGGVAITRIDLGSAIRQAFERVLTDGFG